MGKKEDQTKSEGVKVKCPKCGHKQIYKGTLGIYTCSNCGSKGKTGL